MSASLNLSIDLYIIVKLTYFQLVNTYTTSKIKRLKMDYIELPYDPAIPFLGIYPEKSIIQKDTGTPVFTAALFTIAETLKQPKCPSTEE